MPKVGSMYGRDFEYANTRLAGSMVRDGEGNLIIVHRVSGQGRCEVEVGATGEVKTCKLSELNLEPLQMGYVNCHNRVAYIMRIPRRDDWRQGIRTNTMHILQGDNRPSLAALDACVKGSYPRLGVCIQRASEGHEMSFHRRWALRANYELHYCGKRVGSWNEQAQLTLQEKHIYLQESLERAISSS